MVVQGIEGEDHIMEDLHGQLCEFFGSFVLLLQELLGAQDGLFLQILQLVGDFSDLLSHALESLVCSNDFHLAESGEDAI